eukprot:393554-Alexandrium_andersonii.AAC.1
MVALAALEDDAAPVGDTEEDAALEDGAAPEGLNDFVVLEDARLQVAHELRPREPLGCQDRTDRVDVPGIADLHLRAGPGAHAACGAAARPQACCASDLHAVLGHGVAHADGHLLDGEPPAQLWDPIEAHAARQRVKAEARAGVDGPLARVLVQVADVAWVELVVLIDSQALVAGQAGLEAGAVVLRVRVSALDEAVLVVRPAVLDLSWRARAGKF